MVDRQLVTRSCVMLDNEVECALEYYLECTKTKKGVFYGITIEQVIAGKKAETNSYIFRENRENVLETLQILADNVVFPYTMCDHLTDGVLPRILPDTVGQQNNYTNL